MQKKTPAKKARRDKAEAAAAPLTWFGDCDFGGDYGGSVVVARREVLKN